MASDPEITKGGLYAGTFASYTLVDANVRALLSNNYWTSDAAGLEAATEFTYFFPTSADEYPDDYQDPSGLAAFKPATDWTAFSSRALSSAMRVSALSATSKIAPNSRMFW